MAEADSRAATTTPVAPLGDAARARRFAVAWIFLLVSGLLGVALRASFVVPVPGLNYGHVLHAHSHVAFLGWVFNAFFVAALRHFIPGTLQRDYTRTWWVLQAAVLGMLVTFPFTGYAAASITATTLHMLATIVFASRLWRGNHAAPAAGWFLRVSLVCMLVSGLGPLALGPLAALGLRDAPAYSLSIYFYLHFQYNGWFLFFLVALALQRRHEQGRPVPAAAARRAGTWLAAGTVLTYALSALWCDPPSWVRGAAFVGGAIQLVGCALLWRAWRHTAAASEGSVAARILHRVAVVSFLLKFALQFLAGWPGWADEASQRFVAIAFLHLVFLGVVTPALTAWAIDAGWLRAGWCRHAGVGLLLIGTFATEMLLIAPTGFARVGWTFALPLVETLLAAAIVIVVGVALLGLVLRPLRSSEPNQG